MPSEAVKVVVRVRPLNQREKAQKYAQTVSVDADQVVLSKNDDQQDTEKVFTFDSVFDPNSTQQLVYEKTAFSLVESVLSGYNGTILAYGQTGCGKTHTMSGVPDDEELKGIIPRAFEHIYANITVTEQRNFLIRCSYIEIYNEEIHDLLGSDVNKKLELKESSEKGIYVKDLSLIVVKSVAEIVQLMALGFKNRRTAETSMNKDSSRSHSIFTVYVESSELDEKKNVRIKLGKLNLVDLAGSERQKKTGTTGDRLKEANKINLSLSALGNVISALVDGKSSHIPYRDSKLTRLLQDSLGGNTKTVMIANVSPASDSYDETLGTLRYAARAKHIKNQPKVNEDPKDALLREYSEEINRLKSMLENKNPENASTLNVKSNQSQVNHLLKEKEEEIQNERKRREEIESKLKDIEQQMFKGGDQKGDQSQKEKYQEMAERLQEQEKIHAAIIQDRNKKEEEALLIEKKYGNLQEEVLEQRQLIKELRKKYNQAQQEIKDLQHEYELEKEDMLDNIRILATEVKMNNCILKFLLTPTQLSSIRGQLVWRDDLSDFVVPPHMQQQKDKRIHLPKIIQEKNQEVIQEDQENSFENEEDDRSLPATVKKPQGGFKKIIYHSPDENDSFSSENEDSNIRFTMNHTNFYKMGKENILPSIKSTPNKKMGEKKAQSNNHLPPLTPDSQKVFMNQFAKRKVSNNAVLKPLVREGVGIMNKKNPFEESPKYPERGAKVVLAPLGGVSNLQNDKDTKIHFRSNKYKPKG